MCGGIRAWIPFDYLLLARVLLSCLASSLAFGAYACSCALPIDMEGELRLHPPFAIFEAQAISVTDHKLIFSDHTDPRLHFEKIEQRVKWRIRKLWKGPYPVGDVVETVTDVASGLCGLSVKQDGTYVVHLSAPAPIALSNCSYTAPSADTKDDVRILDKMFSNVVH